MMKRRIESLTLAGAAIWNIVAAVLTIFGYSNWFKNQGTSAFEEVGSMDYMSTSLIDSLVSVIMIYGLFVLFIGIFNLYIMNKMNQEIYSKKIFIWLLVCILIHFLSFDIIGLVLYIITTTLYSARYRAYKVAI